MQALYIKKSMVRIDVLTFFLPCLHTVTLHEKRFFVKKSYKKIEFTFDFRYGKIRLCIYKGKHTPLECALGFAQTRVAVATERRI